MQVPPPVKHELARYNFDQAKAQIVASVSGVFEGTEHYKKYGHTRLADVVQKMTGFNLDPKSYPQVEMQVKKKTIMEKEPLFNSLCH